MQKQIGRLLEGRVFRKLLDPVPAVDKNAVLAIDVGDLRIRHCHTAQSDVLCSYFIQVFAA